MNPRWDEADKPSKQYFLECYACYSITPNPNHIWRQILFFGNRDPNPNPNPNPKPNPNLNPNPYPNPNHGGGVCRRPITHEVLIFANNKKLILFAWLVGLFS